jgi:CheY-like chemotaxis protein
MCRRAAVAAGSEVPPIMRPRVLLAEDEALLREILHEGLQDEGFEVVSAADGAEALQLYRSRGPYDALLLDEEMPHLTGRQLLARLRSEGDGVAAVLFSGNLEMSDEERAQLGVGPVLRKPVPMSVLATAIRRAIDSRPHP